MLRDINLSIGIKSLIFVISLSFFNVSGCNNNNQLDFFNEPTIRMAPNKSTPLAGVLELSTEVPTRVMLDVSDGIDDWQIEFEDFNTEHSLPVLGFRPGRTHTVLIRAVDEGNNDVIEPTVLEVTTEPLPQDFPVISVTSTPELMEPGVTLFEAAGY